MPENNPPPSPSPSAPAAPAAPAAPSAQPQIPTAPQPSIDKGPAHEPPRKGSVKEKVFSDLRKKAGQAIAPETPPKAEPEKAEPPKPTEPQPEPTPEPAPEPEPATDKSKGKVSPWKLVDEHKAARAKVEQELVELRKSMLDPARAKELEEKNAAAEKRLKELEEHIRYVDYSKSQEFHDKYQKPYEDAWRKAMSDLNELTVQDPLTGQERPIEPKDILGLVNMDLKSARAKAVELYGEFADDVMTHRKEIRSLFEVQNRALEEARKAGAEREAQLQKQHKEHVETLAKEVSGIWEAANKQALEDERFGKFLKLVDGDTEGNERLKKGIEMADRAFAVNPFDPNLTAEERADIIRLHAAVRNRSAAFGRVAYESQLKDAKIAELTAELNKYKNVQPGAGTPKPDKRTAPTTARESVFAALRARATR